MYRKLIPIYLQTWIKKRNDIGSSDVSDSGGKLGGVELGDGVLEVWRLERDGDREWKLEFDVSYNPT